MQKKKIVHIAESFGGGVFSYIQDLVNWLDDDYETAILYGKRSETPSKVQTHFRQSVKCIEIPAFNRGFNPFKILQAIHQIKKQIKKLNPDIVYLHSSMAGWVWRLALIFDRKVKIIYNAHGRYFAAYDGLKADIYAFLERILALWTTKIINISVAEHQSAIDRKITPASKMILIENCIDFDKFAYNPDKSASIRAKYGITDDEILIWMSARLDQQKNPLMLARAAKRVIDQWFNVKIMYIWDWTLQKEVLDYAQTNSISSNIIITGRVNNVSDYASALDIAVLTSRYEWFGLVLLEYIACSKPVIATKVGWIPTIIADSDTTFLIDNDDDEALADKIIFCLKNIDKINKNSEKTLSIYKSRYDLPVMLAKYRQLFNSF